MEFARADPPPVPMPDPSDLEAEVRETVLALLRAWVDPDTASADRFLAYVADDFTGLGTAPGEYFPDREALGASTLKERAEMPHPFTLGVPWLNVRPLGPGLALAEGRLEIEVRAEEETFVEAPRFTLVLAQRDGGWRLVHFHFSVPDAMQDEGDTMGDLLRTRNRELEREVVQRTAELERSLADLRKAQGRLVHQEKMAALGALTAGIAHEIKNPLNFVTNFAGLSRELLAELAEETDADERAALLADVDANAGRIESHARRADAIVRAMMAHARGGGGERRAVPVNALVEEYAGLAEQGYRARHPGVSSVVRLELDSDAGAADVVAAEIGRVIIALVDNALDAGGSGSAVVTVSTHRADGGQVEIRVTDEGPGMAPDVRDRVFDPFFTTKPPGEGTGLGLSLAHDVVVEGHGGALEVESEEGEGTTFVVRLPAAPTA